MGQPAYDYNYNGITLGQAVRRPAPQPERRPDLRVEQGGKAAISPLRAMMQHGVQILAAGRLGLMKIDDSQITYIRLDDQSVLTRRESAVEKWTDTLQAGVTSLLRTMDPPADAE